MPLKPQRRKQGPQHRWRMRNSHVRLFAPRLPCEYQGNTWGYRSQLDGDKPFETMVLFEVRKRSRLTVLDKAMLWQMPACLRMLMRWRTLDEKFPCN